MSWHFEGRTYHDYSEYQSAKAAAERRRAGTGVEEVRAENRRLSETIQRDRKQLDALRGDVRKQMEVTERIRSNVRLVEKNQQRLTQMLGATEQRMQDGFAQIERELSDQRDAIHGVEVNVAELRTQHQRHVEQVRQDFARAQAETTSQIEEARRQQRESEERLQAGIREVDSKVEHDRAERARHTEDQLALVHEEMRLAAESLARIEHKVQELDLGSDLQQVQNRLAVARTLTAQRNASAALSTMMLANADAGSLERKAVEREIELASFQHELERRVRWIQSTLGSGATDDMKDCFRLEIEEILQEATATKDRSAGGTKTYSSFARLRDRADESLTVLEDKTLEIVSSAPIAAEAATERMQKVEERIAALEKIYGGLTDMQTSFARALDPKSDFIVQLKFGSTHVELRAALDGTMSIDGFNHGSAEVCSGAAGQVLESLGDQFLVSQQQIDFHDRTQPLLPSSTRNSGTNSVPGARR